MQSLFHCRLAGLVLSVCCFTTQVFAGDTEGEGPSLLDKINQGMQSGQNGGGAIANYNSLINLIENTIDADWASRGGTASMQPYRNGVRIDSKGVIERFDPKKLDAEFPKLHIPDPKKSAESNVAVPLDELGVWQEPSPLRWISLHQLDKQIAKRWDTENPIRANVAMELLAGLYRIDYVAFDQENNEWLLGGPAGKLAMNASGDLTNADTGLPPVLLEDLLAVAPHVLSHQGEFGCTIDPDPQRLTEAHAMAKTASSLKSLARNPEKWAEQWRQKLGKQYAKVIGLRQDSPTGYALLIADAHMKRLGLELERCPTPLKSYWQEKEIFGNINHDTGIVRWWFSLTDHKIPMDPARHIYHFNASNVQVLSESQMMNAMGERVTANTPDIAADVFARDFSLHFDKIQRAYPIYGRLRHVFDLAVALEIVRSEINRGNGKDFVILDQAKIQPRLETAPLEIDTVAATHRMPEGTMSAIVSGGVSIHVGPLSKRLKTDRMQVSKIVVKSPASENEFDDEKGNSVSPLDVPFWR